MKPMPPQSSQLVFDQCKAMPKELKVRKRQCWGFNCKSRAWLQNWMGWRYCFKHWYFFAKEGDDFLFDFRTVKIKL